jgi:DNA topoisomerase-1
MASQMANAKFERTSITIKAVDNLGQNNLFRASGEHRLEVGYQVLFDDKPNDGVEKDLNEEKLSNQNVFGIEENESISCKKLTDNPHDTEPPPRFNPASLIKLLEDLGVGRPSTYASILSVLTERNYTNLEQLRFTPTSNG